MSIEHVNCVDSERHEPKGADAATIGQVFVSDGAASGAFTTIKSYGGIGLYNSAGTAIASDIGTTPVKVVEFDTDMPSFGVIPDATTDNDLTIAVAGDYVVSFSASIATNAGADAGQYQFRLRVNGSEGSTHQALGCNIEMSGSADTQTVSFSGITTFAVNDTLTIWVESDAASGDDIDFNDLIFSVHLVG